MDSTLLAVSELSSLAPDHGKRRLIEAALRLAARSGAGLSALGLRELAREAELNVNTFYRHFENVEDLGRAMAQELAAQLMSGLQDSRRKAARHADATLGSVQYFLDFVRRNPEAFSIGLRELHSAHSPMRPVLQKVLAQIAAESVDQITELDLVPGVDRPTLLQATTAITYYMFYRALDVIERPEQRKAIAEQMVWHIRSVFLGAAQGR